MKALRTTQTLIFLIFLTNSLYSQYKTDEQLELFSSRVDNPIQIEVVDKGDRVIFYSVNKSYYPYIVRFEFTNLQNLTLPYQNKIIALHGRNSLFTLTKINKNEEHGYQYKWSYSFGGLNSKPDLSYPYLFPIGPLKKVEPCYLNDNTSKFFINDYFKVNKGDTAFCMRKGEVVAIPDMPGGMDRIAKDHSLEIRHQDGTVMIYQNIDSKNTIVDLGQTVFPGEPLGSINIEKLLRVSLYELEDDGKIRVLKINYFLGENKISTFSDSLRNVEIKYPFNIISKEMTKREKKKLEKSLKEEKKH